MRSPLAWLLVLALVVVSDPLSAQGRGGGDESGGPGAARGAGRKGKEDKKKTPQRDQLPPALHLETGEYPTVHPQASGARSDAGPVHGDKTGGCDQTLLTVRGAWEGGFAAVWQDERQGNAGLFVGRIRADGSLGQPEEPISEQVGTARELQPAVAATADGTGAFVWMKMSGRSQAHLRFFQPKRDDWSGLLPLSSPQFRRSVEAEMKAGASPREARGRDAIEKRGAPNLPQVAAGPDGRLLVSWQESGRVYLQPFTDGYPERGPLRVNGDQDGLPALGPAHVVLNQEGRILGAWDTEEDGIQVFSVFDRLRKEGEGPLPRPDLSDGGDGELVRILADPLGGWWLLARRGDDLLLRHLSPEGSLDRDEITLSAQPARAADLATWDEGLVLLLDVTTESPGGEPTRTIELRLFGVGGLPTGAEPLRIAASARAKGAFLATEGPAARRILVAWNDDRDAKGDIFFSFLERGEEELLLSAETRWNTDGASSYQLGGSVASTRERAVVAWEDERASEGHIYYRLLGADGAWLTDERPAGGDEVVRDRRMHHVTTALNPDGRFLLTWKESDGPRQPFRLRAQTFAPDGEPLSAPFEIDSGFEASGHHAAATAVLGRNQGYVCVWIRAGFGPVAQRLSLSGELLGAAWRLTDRSIESAANPALLRMSPRRLVCVWDEVAVERTRVLTGRFLGSDARPLDKEIRFDWSANGGDIDAELAPGREGGFLISWTANDGPPRDIQARFYDAEGRPQGPPLGISTIRNEQDFCDVARLADGSWVVVWEDDLSGTDHAVARRVSADGRVLGPAVALDPWTAEYLEVRHSPRVSALGDGFVTLWADHGSGRGVDVFLRRFGPDFDEIVPEPPADEAAVRPGDSGDEAESEG
ncbi:MAG: hypothetical protein AAF682_24365 [Planctomycetota bacterium]